MSWQALSRYSSLPDGWAHPALDGTGNGPYRLLVGLQRALSARFLSACLDPGAAQRAALDRVLDAARGTDFAGAHGLAGVRTLAEYRRAVPISGHEAHGEGLAAEAAGRGGAMTRHRVRSLVKTSGTTGEPKLLPVTRPWARTVAEAQALWVLGAVREQEALAWGAALTTVGAAVEGRSAGGLPYGANTGRMHRAQPWLVRRKFAVPYEVFLLEDPVLRHYALLRLALSADVRSWTTANPSTILALCRAASRWEGELRADVAAGTLERGPAAVLDPRWRRRWRRALRPRALPDGPLRLGEAWRLEAVNCWKGGAAPFFLSRLPGALGCEPVVREVGISASEGYFAIPLHSTWSGGVAWAGGHLLELVPVGGGDALGLEEAETGREYRLVISTTAGLYRYDLDDVVRVEGRYGRAPVLSFRRKGRDVLSVTGEKLTVGQVLEAAAGVIGGAAGFSLGVRMAEVPAYRLVVEGEVCADAGARLDAALRALNSEYAGKRDTDRLAPPEVVQVAEGTFDRWRAERLATAAEGQVKDPVLVHDPAVLRRLEGGWS